MTLSNKIMDGIRVMRIQLDRGAGRAGRASLSRQIQLHFERLISQGLLAAGMKLPASRELARELGVNRTTVALAYDELVAGGWARAHVGQGTFVADRVPAPVGLPRAATPRLDWTGFLSKGAQVIAADTRRRRGYSQVPQPGPGAISFAGGMPDSGLFPTDAFRRVLNRVIREEGRQLLQVPMKDGGLDPEHLDRLLERQSPKLLYCQPSAHNPTGLTMQPEARKRLLEVAARHRLPIMEDGFDGSLFFGPQPPAPLKALDVSGLVVYVGTFSKILFPGLRLGWVVAAPELIERLEVAKELADIHTSPLIQAAVYHFCRQRLLDRHQARVLREYGRRRAALLGSLVKRMPTGVTWTETEGGFSLLVTLPAGLDAAPLLERAAARGVIFTPGNAFFVDGGGERTLRLSFSALPLAQIDEGIKRLAEIIRDVQRQPEPVGLVAAPAVPR